MIMQQGLFEMSHVLMHLKVHFFGCFFPSLTFLMKLETMALPRNPTGLFIKIIYYVHYKNISCQVA